MADGVTDIELNLSLRNYTRNVDAANKSARNASASIDDMTDSARDADKQMGKLGKGVNVKIKVDDRELISAQGELTDLNAVRPNVTISATYPELTEARDLVTRIGGR